MSSSAAASGRTLARVACRSPWRWRAPAPAGCACRRPAGCSASPPRGPAAAGSLGEAQLGQVGLDLRPQLVGVAARAVGALTPSASWPAAPGPVGGAHPAVELGARLGGEARALVDERGGAVGSSSPERSSAAARSRRSTSVSRRSGSVMRGAILRAQRRALPEDAVDEAGRLGAAERLGGLDGLVDGALGGDRVVAFDEVGVEHLEQRGAEDRLLERRDAVERPALGVAPDRASSSSALSAVACASARVKIAASRSKTSSSGRPVRSCW